MNILNFIVEYWSQLTILILAIGFLLKSIFNFYLKKQEIKFDFIHKERAQIIKKLHIDITRLSRQLEFLAMGHSLAKVKVGPTIKEGIEVFRKVVELNKEIKVTVEENKIYFSDNFIQLFDELFKNVSDNIILTSVNKNLTQDSDKKFEFNDTENFFKYFNNGFPELERRLLVEFRKYL